MNKQIESEREPKNERMGERKKEINCPPPKRLKYLIEIISF